MKIERTRMLFVSHRYFIYGTAKGTRKAISAGGALLGDRLVALCTESKCQGMGGNASLVVSQCSIWSIIFVSSIR